MNKLKVFENGERGYEEIVGQEAIRAILTIGDPQSIITVNRVRAVGNDQQTVQLTLRQKFARPSTSSSLLSDLMEGHTAFQNSDSFRTTWQNVSRAVCAKLRIFGTQPGDWDALDNAENRMLALPDVPFNYKEGARLIVSESLTARTWKDPRTGLPTTQQAKRTSADGDFLTVKGQKIYRTVTLSIPGMVMPEDGRAWNEDKIIRHDVVPTGSTIRTRQAAAMNFSPNVTQQVRQMVRTSEDPTNSQYAQDKTANAFNEAIESGDPDMSRQTPTTDENLVQSDSFAGAKEELETKIGE